MCRDSMVDECSRPHPTTAIHVDTIHDCMNNCNVFALEGRCKFIIFHFDNIDENCVIMNDDFDQYIGHCNELGQPLWGQDQGEGIARWAGCSGDTCKNNGAQPKSTCNTCTDCSDTGCRGYILSHCTIFSKVLEESDQTTFDHCEIWARTTGKGTYVHYDREQAVCQVYGEKYDEWTESGFERDCEVAIVEFGTDPDACGLVKPTLPPTTAPPDCNTDGDCTKPDEICVNNLCVTGCRTSADCKVHPCACTGECTDGVDPCHWCSKENAADEFGKCAPGCADNSDCVDELICNGMHVR